MSDFGTTTIKKAVLQAESRKTAKACDKITDFGTG